jgi:predicted metal-dependent hydrolase
MGERVRSVRIIRYGPTPDSWTKEMMENEAAVCCADKEVDLYEIFAGGTWEYCEKIKKKKWIGKKAVDDANFAIEEL